MRFFLPSVALLSCADGGTGFYPQQNLWEVDSSSVAFEGVAWGTNAFEQILVHNHGEQEVLLNFAWGPEASDTFRVMQDFVALAPLSSSPVDLAFYSDGSLTEFSGILEVREERTGEMVAVGVSAWVQRDWDADGHDSVMLGGDDCDDSDPSVSPSAVEIWYDGVDQDCAGDSDYDADQDGYERQPEGQDCDDESAEIRPGVADGLDSIVGIDDDCDGYVDEDSVALGDLLVTEIFVGNNPGPSSYIEVQNVASRSIDLAGWSIVVNGASVDLSAHGELQTNQFVVVCRDATWARDWTCTGEWGGEQPLGVAGGTAIVVSPALVVDQVDWTKEWGLVGLNALQRSGELKNSSSSIDPESWCLSDQSLPNGGMGSPGVENGVCGAGL